MKPDGGSLIGFGSTGLGDGTFRAFDPVRGMPIDPPFTVATTDDVQRAVELATEAAPLWAQLPARERRFFLSAIATNLEAKADDLVARAMQETGLSEARLQNELARTCHQLRFYGAEIERGDWLDVRIETAQRERPDRFKPDHRSMLRPLGPVAVFTAGNFPFAYSVAGGDTASAFAAGCPVIVKAHPGHPGTSEMVGRLILHAVRNCGLPEGSFSLLFDDVHAVGQALVQHPDIKAVGFTGSTRGGRALLDLAAARPEPIPVYAEMGSTNPVFILPGALKAGRHESLVDQLHASATADVGQFCTTPGVVVLMRSQETETFVEALKTKLVATPEAAMLTPGLRQAFERQVSERAAQSGVRMLVQGRASGLCGAAPVWFETDALTYIGREALAGEVFGPSSLVIWCRDRREMMLVAETMTGSLTATVHAEPGECLEYPGLLEQLAAKAGRLILNGFPTGVEVSHAMVHAGPYPATGDGGRTSSVGTRSLIRWSRLVCYQNFSDDLLPPPLKNANPLGLRRLINGEWTQAAI